MSPDLLVTYVANLNHPQNERRMAMLGLLTVRICAIIGLLVNGEGESLAEGERLWSEIPSLLRDDLRSWLADDDLILP